MPPVLTVLLGLAALAALYGLRRVKAMWREFGGVEMASGVTGAEAARGILESAGLSEVEVCEHGGTVPDFYDPTRRRLMLTARTYEGRSVAAVAMAAHEASHAVQHRESFTPLSMRFSAVKMTQVLSGVILLAAIAALATGVIPRRVTLSILALSWGGIMVFNLATLPVEFDASKRAREALRRLGFVQKGKESEAVAKALKSAAFTYVGALLTSFRYLVYHLLPFMGRRIR